MSENKRQKIIELFDYITWISEQQKDEFSKLIMQIPEEKLDDAIKYILETQNSITWLINEEYEDRRKKQIKSEEQKDIEKNKQAIEDLEQLIKNSF